MVLAPAYAMDGMIPLARVSEGAIGLPSRTFVPATDSLTLIAVRNDAQQNGQVRCEPSTSIAAVRPVTVR